MALVWHKVVVWLFALLSFCSGYTNTTRNGSFVQACDRDVYCQGYILDKVQMSKAFGDAKTFVDMPMKEDPGHIITPLTVKLTNSKNAKEIKSMVEGYFSKAGTELSNIQPTDWTEDPVVFKQILDPKLREWAKELNRRWKILTRKIKDEVKFNSQRNSLIYSKNPFVVPGGRFREFYYWDTYWVMKGLLLSDMTKTVKGMLENFVELVKVYGFVPNGGRIYYLNRSQPPFLTLMAYEYWQKTNDTAFIVSILPYLEKEYEFWMAQRVVTVNWAHGFKRAHTLNRYSTPMGYPRPESYWNDVETAEKAEFNKSSVEERKKLYAHIASAAESGWDFSSRWFAYSGKHAMTMMSIKTRDIIPVDLNSILCKVEKSLQTFNEVAGNKKKAKEHQKQFEQRVVSMSEVFWDDKRKQWLDFDLSSKKRRSHFYVSNISPIWADCYGNNATRAKGAVESIRRQGVLDFVGGVPTSLNNTGEQWDYPNAWPPLQDIMEVSLRKVGKLHGKDLAFELARKWIQTNYLSWKQTGHMYEKYDANIRGKPGHGGEYGVQVGFGWTNGVVLSFLQRYGDRLKAPQLMNSSYANKFDLAVMLASIMIAVNFAYHKQ
eukprot:Seg1774.3 transcript_id=Seg1774.3/GoldUCD/mRNA.D3Y31 product=Trehalase protein_id=Seg1774.3/GoldUCD/D3Y31